MRGEDLLEVIAEIDDELIAEANFAESGGTFARGTETRHENLTNRRRQRKRLTLLFVAVLVLAFALTSFARVSSHAGLSIAEYLGFSESDLDKIGDGEVSLTATSVDEGVIFRATSAVADAKNAVIRIETDFKLSETIDENTYYTVGDYSYSFEPNSSIFGRKKLITSSSTMEATAEDGYLVIYMKIFDADSLNHANVTVTFNNIVLTKEDEDDKILVSGTWTLQWDFDFTVTKVVKNVNTTINCSGTEFQLKKIVITPLEIECIGTIKHFRNDNSNWDSLHDIDIIRINMKDGTVFDTSDYGGGSFETGFWPWQHNAAAWVSTIELGTALDMENVESITIGDTEITLE